MPAWTPERWDDFTTVGLLIALVAVHAVAYIRGWIIPGRHHREIVEARDRELEKAGKRSAEDAVSIKTLSVAITEQNARDTATNRILEALRETVADH